MQIEVIQIGEAYFSQIIEVPNNCTAKEAIQKYLPKQLSHKLSSDFSLGIWGVNLDGRFLPEPASYRLKPEIDWKSIILLSATLKNSEG